RSTPSRRGECPPHKYADKIVLVGHALDLHRHGHWQAIRASHKTQTGCLVGDLNVLPLKSWEFNLHLVQYSRRTRICEWRFVPCVPIGATSARSRRRTDAACRGTMIRKVCSR